MVSKISVAGLTVLALFSVFHGAAGTSTDFSPCLQGLAYVNLKLNLGIDLKGLLSGVINLVDGVLDSVLNLVGGLLSGLLGGSKPPPCPGPSDLSGVLQLGIRYCNFLEVALRLRLPKLPQGILSKIYIYVVVKGLLAANIDVGLYPFLKNPPSLVDIQADVTLTLSLLKSLTGPWAPVNAFLQTYIGLLNAPKYTSDHVCYAHGSVLQINAAISALSGYSNYNNLVDVNVAIAAPILAANKLPAINASWYKVYNIQKDCKCFSS